MSLSKFGEQLELRSEVGIAQAPQRVWDVLIDTGRYPRWNPFIVQAEGLLTVGGTLRMIISPPGGREVKLTRKVESIHNARALTWSGGYGWGFLLRSRQRFQLTPTNDGAHTRLLVAEDLKGPGVTGNDSLALNVARGTALMNQAFGEFNAAAVAVFENSDVVVSARDAVLAAVNFRGPWAGLTGALAVPASVLRPGSLAVDLMYGPPAAPFLAWARAQGATGRDGLGMLVEQAAEAFALWRGVLPDTVPVLAALRAQVDGGTAA